MNRRENSILLSSMRLPLLVVSFIFLSSFFIPQKSLAAEQADFLSARMLETRSSLICPTPKTCQTVFFIQGKNFLNSNGKPGVYVANQWAKILRATDTQIVAAVPGDIVNAVPVVAVDKTLHRPKLHTNDPVLNQLFDESVEVALESIHTTKDRNRYIDAGPRYSDPQRVYYRDSYWASGMVLLIEPAVVRDQILLLTRGVNTDGSVPSAIPVDPAGRMIPLWIDHHDSGSYFIMMVYDYIRWTSDTTILTEMVGDRTIYSITKDILAHLVSLDKNENYLPEKPANSLQDWLDTIPRGGEVISNEVLYYRALRNMVELAHIMKSNEDARTFDRRSLIVRSQINDQFWNEKKGSYNERCENDVCEDRLTNESSLASLYDVIAPENSARFFETLRQLETTWGVVNAYPPYPGSRAYTYQNMTDWPFLDAMNAGARLKAGNADWYYPLTRWWTYHKENRKPGEKLPEFVSPIDQTGGLSQAWSVAPMVSFVRYGIGLDPTMNGRYDLKSPLTGPIKMENVMVRSRRISIDTAKK